MTETAQMDHRFFSSSVVAENFQPPESGKKRRNPSNIVYLERLHKTLTCCNCADTQERAKIESPAVFLVECSSPYPVRRCATFRCIRSDILNHSGNGQWNDDLSSMIDRLDTDHASVDACL